jgi:hypothetical protein
MDWNLAAYTTLELTKFIALCFWLGLTLRGIWEGLRLGWESLASHRQLRRIGEHRAYRE